MNVPSYQQITVSCREDSSQSNQTAPIQGQQLASSSTGVLQKITILMVLMHTASDPVPTKHGDAFRLQKGPAACSGANAAAPFKERGPLPGMTTALSNPIQGIGTPRRAPQISTGFQQQQQQQHAIDTSKAESQQAHGHAQGVSGPIPHRQSPKPTASPGKSLGATLYACTHQASFLPYHACYAKSLCPSDVA